MIRGSIGSIAAVLIQAAVAGCAGRSSSASEAAPADTTSPPAPTQSAAAAQPDSTQWVVSDSATRTVTLTLEVSRPAGAPSALISGYRAGKAQVVVPLRWMVRWNYRNDDATSPHSLVWMLQREKIPLEGGRPAFSNAMTRSVNDGLPPGQSDQSSFEAEEAGWYWLLCGVEGHAIAGEWIELRVDPEAKGARVQLKT
jgi:Sulfocyanin (SoxE) domain